MKKNKKIIIILLLIAVYGLLLYKVNSNSIKVQDKLQQLYLDLNGNMSYKEVIKVIKKMD